MIGFQQIYCLLLVTYVFNSSSCELTNLFYAYTYHCIISFEEVTLLTWIPSYIRKHGGKPSNIIRRWDSLEYTYTLWFRQLLSVPLGAFLVVDITVGINCKYCSTMGSNTYADGSEAFIFVLVDTNNYDHCEPSFHVERNPGASLTSFKSLHYGPKISTSNPCPLARLRHCVTMLHFQSLWKYWVTVQAKNSVRNAAALHLPKSHTEAIMCVQLIVTYVVREKGMEHEGAQRQALVEPWFKHWRCEKTNLRTKQH